MRQRVLIMTLFMALVLGCGSGGMGGLGGTLGDILGSPGADRPSDIRGTVNRIDTQSKLVVLDVNYVNNLRDTRSNSSVYYDNDTVVEYDGNQYRVEDLERGDEVSIRGSNSGGRYVADRITVTRNVRN